MKKYSFILFLLFVSIASLFAQQREMKVASYNLRTKTSKDNKNGNGWKDRYPAIANLIIYHDLDIVGTQEGRRDQLEDLQSKLPNYAYIGRGRGRKPTSSEYSAIFYNTDKFKLLNNGDFWLSETPDKYSKGWDAALARICSWGEFEEKETGFRFFFFNVHVDHEGIAARTEGLSLVVNKIKEIAGENSPVVLTGDLNVNQESEAYHIVNNSGLLTDAFLLSPIVYMNNGTLNKFNLSRVSGGRIDHIFVTEYFTVTRYGVLTDLYWNDVTPANPKDTDVVKGSPRIPSDHFPVVVGLKYPKEITIFETIKNENQIENEIY